HVIALPPPCLTDDLLWILTDPHTALALPPDSKLAKEKMEEPALQQMDSDEMTIRIGRAGPLSGKPPFIYPHQLFCAGFQKNKESSQNHTSICSCSKCSPTYFHRMLLF
uniref:Uncharacterized protein n=1 Tax=Stegastes partitus TaxID=144197 RepID=A0A3B5AX97_9TELE